MATPASTRWILVLSLLLLLSASSTLAISPADQISSDINKIIAKVHSIQVPASQINIINAALAVQGLGPIPVVTRLLNEAADLTIQKIAALDGTKTLDSADSKKVLEAFAYLVKIEQETLNILIGKGNLVGSVGVLPLVGPPVLQSLKQLEAAQNTLAFKLRDEVLSSEEATYLAKYQESLDPSFYVAFQAWSVDSLPQV